MGLTYAEAKALGLGHLHPAASGRGEREALRELGVDATPPSQAPDDGMNKTERAFAEMLKESKRVGLITQWRREPIKLRLAGRTWYTPDFMVTPRNIQSLLFFVEVKGYMRDDAAAKIKVAAFDYPIFRFLLVRRQGRHGWHVRDVTGRGIGTKPIEVPWILSEVDV